MGKREQFEREWREEEARAREVARMRKNTRRPDGELRHVGRLPTEVYYRLRKEHGHITDEMVKKYFFEHERRGR